MSNKKLRYPVSLDTNKVRAIANKISERINETGLTADKYIDLHKVEILSCLAFSDGTSLISVSLGDRASADILMPKNEYETYARLMEIRYYLWTRNWNELLDDKFTYDYDEFMDEYMNPCYESTEKEKED